MHSNDLESWSLVNWWRVHPLIRNDCVQELRAQLPECLLEMLCKDYLNGQPLGSKIARFSFEYGRAIRNILRRQLLDEELPAIIGPDGGYSTGVEARSWNDYYLGALRELVEQTLARRPC